MNSVNLYEVAKKKTQTLKEPLISRQSLQLSSIKSAEDHHRDVGLSTLLNISKSTIRATHHSIHSTQNNKQRKTLNSEIELMREKLQKIVSQPIVLKSNPQYQIPKPNDHQVSQKKQQQFKIQIRKQINQERCRKFQKALKVFAFSQFISQLVKLKFLTSMRQRRENRMLKQALASWNSFTLEEGERKMIMDAIRNRVIQKRKNKNSTQRQEIELS